jgi:hypothetical protein
MLSAVMLNVIILSVVAPKFMLCKIFRSIQPKMLLKLTQSACQTCQFSQHKAHHMGSYKHKAHIHYGKPAIFSLFRYHSNTRYLDSGSIFLPLCYPGDNQGKQSTFVKVSCSYQLFVKRRLHWRFFCSLLTLATLGSATQNQTHRDHDT